eukprot:TRINITY_DN141_c3_g1_i1.p1 TRINITY_DN141_c3_g1~~TRINITY_DN141_c3_g1_i1.p1  ORF type:complete len:527 (+),score=116.75 TRINITY_DN141_c3_g1_i1:111-1583(+)
MPSVSAMAEQDAKGEGAGEGASPADRQSVAAQVLAALPEVQGAPITAPKRSGGTLCGDWKNGICQRGSSCRFRHSGPPRQAAPGDVRAIAGMAGINKQELGMLHQWLASGGIAAGEALPEGLSPVALMGLQALMMPQPAMQPAMQPAYNAYSPGYAGAYGAAGAGALPPQQTPFTGLGDGVTPQDPGPSQPVCLQYSNTGVCQRQQSGGRCFFRHLPPDHPERRLPPHAGYPSHPDYKGPRPPGWSNSAPAPNAGHHGHRRRRSSSSSSSSGARRRGRRRSSSSASPRRGRRRRDASRGSRSSRSRNRRRSRSRSGGRSARRHRSGRGGKERRKRRKELSESSGSPRLLKHRAHASESSPDPSRAPARGSSEGPAPAQKKRKRGKAASDDSPPRARRKKSARDERSDSDSAPPQRKKVAKKAVSSDESSLLGEKRRGKSPASPPAKREGKKERKGKKRKKKGGNDKDLDSNLLAQVSSFLEQHDRKRLSE